MLDRPLATSSRASGSQVAPSLGPASGLAETSITVPFATINAAYEDVWAVCPYTSFYMFDYLVLFLPQTGTVCTL